MLCATRRIRTHRQRHSLCTRRLSSVRWGALPQVAMVSNGTCSLASTGFFQDEVLRDSLYSASCSRYRCRALSHGCALWQRRVRFSMLIGFGQTKPRVAWSPAPRAALSLCLSLSFSLLIFFLFEKHADDHCNGLLHLHTCSEAYSILPRAKTTRGCRLRKPHDPKIFLHVRTFRFVLYILGCLIRKRQVIVAS